MRSQYPRHAGDNRPMLDVLIAGGRVVDGTGAPAFEADVGIAGDRVVAVGAAEVEAARTIDASGLLVCPGFIDMHTHSDLRLLVEPAHEAKVCQGVTLEVLGHDGLSYAPVTDDVLARLRTQLAGWNGDPDGFDWSWRSVGEYLERIDGSAVNAVYLVPHGTIRMCAMGNDDRPPTRTELAQMRTLLAEAIDEGAFGLSAGLTYAPGMYADDDELVALLEVVRNRGGYYCPHHRNYGLHALDAYADSIEVARRAGVPLHLAHAHLGFPVNRGRAPELLAAIDGSDVDITLDTYPYLAGNTYLAALLPSWMHAGGPEATLVRLRNPALRERLRAEIEVTGSDGFHGLPVDWSTIVVDGEPVGERGLDWVCATLVERELDVACITHTGNEENVRTIMRHRSHTVGSDGILVGSLPHPRGYGTFPRYFAVYVRELGILGWEECVRKMTGLPAQRLGVADRGVLREGAYADVTCIDPETIRDAATYEQPRRLPEGIPYVLVNGRLAVDRGRRTDVLAGRAIRS
jgi:N-acyl-D-amino-acid deacylase